MALTPKLDLRQAQTLVMTPQLQQAIRLLQMSNMEVAEFVEAELEENPLLERDEGTDGGDADSASPSEASDTQTADDAQTAGDALAEDGPLDEAGPRDSATLTEAERLPDANEAPLDTDYENVWEGNDDADAVGAGFAGARAGAGAGGDFDGRDFDLEKTLSESPSLRDHLTGQLNMDIADPADRMIGLHLIESLDEAGYFVGDIDDIAERLSCDRATVERILTRMQEFDPAGIFARGLAECLRLQLRDRNLLDAPMAALIDNLDLVAERDKRALMRICDVDQEHLAKLTARLRELDPKPGLAFDHVIAQTVIPDVFVRARGKQGWHVELNSETLPRVLVNERYYAQVSRVARRKDEKEYLSERFHAANWLVRSLHQRATTILRVATEIVRQQDDFLAKGVKYLHPLTLRDIAEAIEMHESTVSRVTSNKYLATPRGIYELKYFFTNAISDLAGRDIHSAEAVRFRIRKLIDDEPPMKVLSDDKIVATLQTEGIAIARRTVAKYREAMRIPSSVQRRRQKRAEMAG
ncbi:MAG: RNA polymerase factor sigma-54 [Alphaproteobacteria bacterium]